MTKNEPVGKLWVSAVNIKCLLMFSMILKALGINPDSGINWEVVNPSMALFEVKFNIGLGFAGDTGGGG